MEFHYDEALHGRHTQQGKLLFFFLGIIHWILAGVFLYRHYVQGADRIDMFLGYGLFLSGALQFFSFFRARMAKVPEEGTQYIKFNAEQLEYKHPSKTDAIYIPIQSMTDIRFDNRNIAMKLKDGEQVHLPMRITEGKSYKAFEKYLKQLRETLKT